MAANDDPVVLRIIASQKDLEKSMASAVRTVERYSKTMETLLEGGIGGGARKGGQQLGVAVEKQMRIASQGATNLSYQLNDIASSLAGGASPFIVMMQQGSQVAQVFQGLQASGLSMGSALATAFTQVLNPISLLSFAVIGLTGYLVQMYTKAGDEADKAKEKTLSLVEVANQLRESRGLERVSTVESAAVEFERALQAEKRYAEGLTELKTLMENISAAEGPNADMLPVGLTETEAKVLKPLNDAIVELRRGIKAGTPDFLAFAKSIKAIKIPADQLDDYQELVATLLAGASATAVQKAEYDALSKSMDANAGKTELLMEAHARQARFIKEEGERLAKQREKEAKEAEDAAEAQQKAFDKAYGDLQNIAVKPLNDLQKAISLYTQAVQAATTMQQGFTASLEATKAVGRVIEESTTGLFGSVSKTFDKMYEGLTKVDDKTKEFIRQRESFRAEAYWDVNHYRVGFGSDTFVDEMGKIREVTKSTVVTVAQAEADLANRIRGFQATIMNQIGPNFWQQLNDNQQAALTSIAYNYGSLPAAVVKAIKDGDQGQVARAIAGLGSDNGGVNRARREMEAQLYATGAQGSPLAVGEDITKVEQSNELLREKLKIMGALNVEYDKAVAKQEGEFRVVELLAEAKRQAADEGRVLTDEETASITKQGMEYGVLKTQLDAATEAQRKLAAEQKKAGEQAAEYGQQLSSAMQGAISGFISDLRNGVSAGEAFNNMLNRIIDSIIDMALQAMFSTNAMKSLFTGLGGLFSPAGVAKSGGMVGFTGLAKSSISPLAFAGAPKYARGGVVGYDPGAVPIIAHRGEVIIPTSAMRKTATQTRQPEQTHINAPSNIQVDIANGTGDTQVTTEGGIKFAQMLDRSVQAIIVRESRPGGLLRRPQGRR